MYKYMVMRIVMGQMMLAMMPPSVPHKYPNTCTRLLSLQEATNWMLTLKDAYPDEVYVVVLVTAITN